MKTPCQRMRSPARALPAESSSECPRGVDQRFQRTGQRFVVRFLLLLRHLFRTCPAASGRSEIRPHRTAAARDQGQDREQIRFGNLTAFSASDPAGFCAGFMSAGPKPPIPSAFLAVRPGFEPGLKAPKTSVLPLHHRTAPGGSYRPSAGVQGENCGFRNRPGFSRRMARRVADASVLFSSSPSSSSSCSIADLHSEDDHEEEDEPRSATVARGRSSQRHRISAGTSRATARPGRGWAPGRTWWSRCRT